jgi:adenylyltransferase/sulfurtransferase
MEGRYSRQILFAPVGEEGQKRLREARVLIVGCGALGSHSAEQLARAGVGALRLVDRDVVEWSNLQRQSGFEESDARARGLKVEALAARLSRVNSEVALEIHPVDFNFTNALDLAAGADLILDGTDNLPSRFLLNDVSYRLQAPWIYAGAIGGTGHVQFYSGKEGPCLRCQLDELPVPGTLATCDTGGILGPAAGVAASWQAALALRYLSERDPQALAGKKALLSPWDLSARVVLAQADPECPVCAQGRFDALEGEGSGSITALCGREAVQVVPSKKRREGIDLGALARRLEGVGSLERRARFLRLRMEEGVILTLFEDGRAIFDGLTDTARARSLYARYVGE